MQGRSLHAGLKAFARDRGCELVVEDDESAPSIASFAHARLRDRGCDVVLGPYGSDTTRALALALAGDVVWNHGAAADDVQTLPGVVSVPSPASGYLVALACVASELGATRIAVLTARGRFARLAHEGVVRAAPALGVELVAEPKAADAVLVCGPVDWEAQRLRDWARSGRIVGGISPGLAHAPWPDGTLAPVQWHPDLGGPAGLPDYVAAQAYAAASIAEQCRERSPDDPLAAARTLVTRTFFGAFQLDRHGLQVGHRLSVVRWRNGRQELAAF